MASALDPRKDADDDDSWKAFDENDDDESEFFDANEAESSTSKGENNLLHERLNEKLKITDETTPTTEAKPKSPEDPYFVDEDFLVQQDALLTDEEKETRYVDSKKFKDEGNELYGLQQFEEALKKYGEALNFCPIKQVHDRAVIYANRAACLMKMEKYEAAVQSCTKSIDLEPNYVKALIRRAESYKMIDKLEEALQDFQKVLAVDPSNAQAKREVQFLPDQIKERNEKLKEEMLGKLKDLGNMILKPFGLSTNNFKLQQDPTTGSYSVNFQK